ncbi:MAG: cell division protein FtsQ/DivIB [Phycisphaerae bacterium]
MAKKKKKKTARAKSSGRNSWLGGLDAERKRRFFSAGARAGAVLVVVAALCVGMARLDRYVHADERFTGPAKLVLVNVPDGLEKIVREHLAPVSRTGWTEQELCRRMADRLAESAWVRRVNSVRRLPIGVIEIRCAYRTPTAMVQSQDGFVLLDGEGVRLPGLYPYSSSFSLIQGVAGRAPEPGERWEAGDVEAGLSLWKLMSAEPFEDQVSAVLVHNYAGRENPEAAHIELATDRAGGRVIWGSAPGEEIEENSAAQKMAILRHNHRLHGRIDAGRPVIDVSTFPDRFTTPAS